MDCKIERYIHRAIERHAERNLYPTIGFFNHILRKITFSSDGSFYFQVITAVKINDGKRVLKILDEEKSIMNIAARIKKIDANFVKFCQELFNDNRVNPARCFSYLLIFAAVRSNIPLLKLCLADERFNPVTRNNNVFEDAIGRKQIEVVSLLLKDPRINPAQNDNYAIRVATYHGHTALVRLLLEDTRINPADLGNEALAWAFEAGYTTIASLLLDDSRIKFGPPGLLYSAVAHNNSDLIRLVYSSPKCIITEKMIVSCLKNYRTDSATTTCLQEILIEKSWNKFRFFAQFATNNSIPKDIIQEIGVPFGLLNCS